MGLAGLGDLVLTCTDDQSRNRRFGMALGRGQTVTDAQRGIHQVVEGLPAAAGGDTRCHGGWRWRCPFVRKSTSVMHEGKPVKAAVQALMGRQMRSETE